jgi:hypothetical protein
MLKFLRKVNWVAVIFTVINSIILAVFFDLAPNLRLSAEVNVTYQDFAATLLTAVAIIIAVFGAVLGVLGLRGYNNIREEAVRKAEEHIKQSLLDGGCLNELVKRETIEQARLLGSGGITEWGDENSEYGDTEEAP